MHTFIEILYKKKDLRLKKKTCFIFMKTIQCIFMYTHIYFFFKKTKYSTWEKRFSTSFFIPILFSKKLYFCLHELPTSLLLQMPAATASESFVSSHFTLCSSIFHLFTIFSPNFLDLFSSPPLPPPPLYPPCKISVFSSLFHQKKKRM